MTSTAQRRILETNIGWACTGLQCELGRGNRTAYRFLAPGHPRREATFDGLNAETSRAANALRGIGLEPGSVFFTFLPKAPEQFHAFLGALKARVVVGTLFSNFGEDALADRLGDAGAVAVLTRRSLVRKLVAVRDRVPTLRTILVIDAEQDDGPEIRSWPRLMEAAKWEFPVEATDPETPSVLHYTSGSTGKPKGVVHVHASLMSQRATTERVLGLRESDIYWCTADQGWVTGTSYGIIGPWSLGVTQVHYAGPYDPDAWFSLLEAEGVTVWYTAPTALRMLCREPPERLAGRDLSRLRGIFSVGEPLNPEVIAWGRKALSRDIYDTWFQTETGAIMIANRPDLEIRPGSMGKPVDGIHPLILDDAGKEVPDLCRGNLCIETPWPSMFRGYKNADEVYAKKFIGGAYFTGDTAYRDRDGYYWFCGRSDDVINTAGHLVSPFEVESALLEIPEVAESGVAAAPDPVLFEKVVAFVRLRQGVEFNRALELKLRLHVSTRVSSVATPQDIVIVESIPKNRAGKIMRRVLKSRYLGVDEGDTSTLETEP